MQRSILDFSDLALKNRWVGASVLAKGLCVKIGLFVTDETVRRMKSTSMDGIQEENHQTQNILCQRKGKEA